MISKDITLIEFLTTKNCQWKSLNRYEDELKHETECINLNTKPCDNCMTAKNMSRDQKRKLEFELKEQEKWVRIKSYEK